MKKTSMTREGFNKMSEEYNKMRQLDLKECLSNLADAREKGNLTENSEFEVAKQALNELNSKLSKIGTLLSNAHIVEGVVDNGTVQMLTWVKFRNLKTLQENEYKIVPEHEGSLKENKISQFGPIGKALINRKIGDIVNVTIPAGLLQLEILNIRCK
jgi:transcription elongation factor GreA